MLSAGLWQVCGNRLKTATRTSKNPENKGNKKMKGLALTILLAVLEISAVMTSRSDLMSDGQVAAARREEAGIQSEVIVDAEQPEVVAFEPAAEATEII
jgi:hypothetical protein